MPEGSLPAAANTAYFHLSPLWSAGTLRTKLLAFANAVAPTFPESEVKSHPVSNWVVLILALGTSMSAAAFAEPQTFRQACDYVFRICWVTNRLATQTPAQITGAQAAAVLAAYNAQFP